MFNSKMIIGIILLALFFSFLGIASFADDAQGVQTYSIKANQEQLRRLNEVGVEEFDQMSTYEIMTTIYPEEYNKMTEEEKKLFDPNVKCVPYSEVEELLKLENNNNSVAFVGKLESLLDKSYLLKFFEKMTYNIYNFVTRIF